MGEANSSALLTSRYLRKNMEMIVENLRLARSKSVYKMGKKSNTIIPVAPSLSAPSALSMESIPSQPDGVKVIDKQDSVFVEGVGNSSTKLQSGTARLHKEEDIELGRKDFARRKNFIPDLIFMVPGLKTANRTPKRPKTKIDVF